MITLLILLAFIAILLWLAMTWARFWPRVVCTNFDLEIVELSINGKKLYKPKVSYSYSHNERSYKSNRLTLFGGRTYPSRVNAQNVISEKKAYICPIKPNFSYISQDARVFWGLLFLSFIGFIFTSILLLIT